jgi:hypothetical protein
MAVAKARLLQKPATGFSNEEAAIQAGVHANTVSQANMVLKEAPDLVDAVMAGAMSLGAAYDEAQLLSGLRQTASQAVTK